MPPDVGTCSIIVSSILKLFFPSRCLPPLCAPMRMGRKGVEDRENGEHLTNIQSFVRRAFSRRPSQYMDHPPSRLHLQGSWQCCMYQSSWYLLRSVTWAPPGENANPPCIFFSPLGLRTEISAQLRPPKEILRASRLTWPISCIYMTEGWTLIKSQPSLGCRLAPQIAVYRLLASQKSRQRRNWVKRLGKSQPSLGCRQACSTDHRL